MSSKRPVTCSQTEMLVILDFGVNSVEFLTPEIDTTLSSVQCVHTSARTLKPLDKIVKVSLCHKTSLTR